jgi:hypothetical protein
MGFLSRKSKHADTAVKEQDGIVEELHEMEEAVPERPNSTDVSTAKPAGPVTADGPSSSRDDAAGEEPSPAPPAGATKPESGRDDSVQAEGAGGEDEAGLSLEEIQRVWPAVLDHLLKSAPALAATFEGARPIGLDDEGLQIGFPGNATFNKKKAEEPERRELVAKAFETVTGERQAVHYVLLDGGEGNAEAKPPEDAVDHEALVEKLKSEFDAEEVG